MAHAQTFIHFNSIKVRLERWQPLFLWLLSRYFNSIKVRLELPPFALDEVLLLFQFHKGTIRTRPCRDIPMQDSHFNSIKVRLEHFLLVWSNRLAKNFNSIKVRLEPVNLQETAGTKHLFQFHKGTIRTYWSRALQSPLCRNFNSIKVRLERRSLWPIYYFDRYFNSIKVRLEPAVGFVCLGLRDEISIP